jgi:prepilin-type N-terminal cleavage/methylation domain-containing protein
MTRIGKWSGSQECLGPRAGSTGSRAFTVIELLVVVTLISVIAALLLPALSRAKDQARRVRCTSNERQLYLAWATYAGDYAEKLAANGAVDGSSPVPAGVLLWVKGGSHSFAQGLINPACLAGSTNAAFAPYLKALAIFRCPSDDYFTTFGTGSDPGGWGEPMQTLRSYSMNCYVGQVDSIADYLSSNYFTFRKTTDFVALPPARTFLFQEVNPANICFPAFVVRPTGFDIDGFFHYPATRHQRASVIGWADGHTDTHRWTDERTFLCKAPPDIIGHWTPCPNNADLNWIRERTTVRK